LKERERERERERQTKRQTSGQSRPINPSDLLQTDVFEWQQNIKLKKTIFGCPLIEKLELSTA